MPVNDLIKISYFENTEIGILHSLSKLIY